MGMPWDEAVERAGSFEALLPPLRDGRILARHQGLRGWPECRKTDGPGEIPPDWWASARVDPVVKRVIFKQPRWPHFFDEEFAVDLELERARAEALWPIKSKPPEREHVEAAEQTKPVERERMQPKAWLAWARKEYPQQRNERPTPYIRRLHGLMQKTDNVTEVWTFETFRVRYYEEVKADQQTVQKARKLPRTV